MNLEITDPSKLYCCAIDDREYMKVKQDMVERLWKKYQRETKELKEDLDFKRKKYRKIEKSLQELIQEESLKMYEIVNEDYLRWQKKNKLMK